MCLRARGYDIDDFCPLQILIYDCWFSCTQSFDDGFDRRHEEILTTEIKEEDHIMSKHMNRIIKFLYHPFRDLKRARTLEESRIECWQWWYCWDLYHPKYPKWSIQSRTQSHRIIVRKLLKDKISVYIFKSL